ncbi:4-hydroxyphenylacetate decarboxylase large subunit [uncultured Roseburia sp.]|uniref:Uncharacterized protein n=1 Tax=Brotonthovivens ammoniilytica TaxID=2981725 RepID=A0ABT2THB6_9FIRM|nr:pyruvate formate lyase family protein [Brotonthovivens ammoniilytica]MCU6761583.1 hypothetical protein [Brotonthovivens ammoniilytica]SCI32717.1 4-hydroxyphenylacetate decarboxylase large subunit [uncultured Roseburia sp.]
MYSFGPVSPRVQIARSRMRNTTPYIDITRYKIVTDFYRNHPELSGSLRRALNFKNLCEKMPCTIFEGELIVGSYVQKCRASALYPENSIDFLIDELKSGLISTRESDPYLITEEDREYILSTADYWLGECMNSKLNPYLPETFSRISAGGPLFFTPSNICPQPVGHFVPNHEKAVLTGFGAIRNDALKKMAELEVTGFTGSLAEQYNFYHGISIVCEGMIIFSKRYSKACSDLAENTADVGRRQELLEMSQTLDWIMEHPARNYKEALQTVWFYQMCVLMDANLHGTSLGRVDQFTGPFLEKDLREGTITRQEAQEYMDLFYIKAAEMNKVWSERTSRSGPGYNSGMLITIGGTDQNGCDAANTATFLCLEAAGRLKLHTPPQGIRIHEQTPEEIWNCALAVNKQAGGLLAFFSDKVITQALIKRGISKADVWNYCPVGCVEPSIGGSEWPACGGIGISSYLNIVNILLLAINNGKNYLPNPNGSRNEVQFGPQTGYLYEMKNIEDVKKAYLTQLKFWLKWHVNVINLYETVAHNFLPQPVVSAAMNGCMESGTDVTKGGAKYNSTGHSAIGLGNVVDSLNVLEHLCFKENICTTRELYDALLNNWKGHEQLHDYIICKMPHYGNGNPEYDKYCRWTAKTYADAVNSMTGPRGQYAAGLFPVTMNVVYGLMTAASPDGRFCKEPLSDGISAVQGLDKSGPTAILRSVSSFDHTDYSNGTLLNMKFHPTILSSEEGYTKLINLMKTYFFELGGMEMQFNIVSAQTLKDAQLHPENYRDLVVRIAGFAAYFVDVFKSAQDDLIRRTELGL